MKINTARWSLFAVLSLACLACAGSTGPVERQGRTEGRTAMSGDLSRVDHIILGINDLQKGIEELERMTGVRAVFGGAHPGRGTQNALISLGEPFYLEILAPNPEDQDIDHSIDDLKRLETLTPVGWAARSDDLDALQQSLRSQGIESGEIRPGARNRPDGSRISWRTLGLSSRSPLLPFFIEWGRDSSHPSATSPGGCRLTGFTLEDPAPDTLRRPLEAAGVRVAVRQGSAPLIRIALACPKGNVEIP